MNYNAEQLRARIAISLPLGTVITEHKREGHFYRIKTPDVNGIAGNVYPSVTGKIQIIKDEGLINYKKNRVIDYVFGHYKEFTDSNIMDHLERAERLPEDILADAGDIGTDIHEVRENIFRSLMAGNHIEDFLSFVPPDKDDIRIKSAIRALSAFCKDYEYVPLATELFVYSHKLKVAGTLDDIGLITKVVRPGGEGCEHEYVNNLKRAEKTCLKCGQKKKTYLVLLDVKTSNRFKDHYFFQVALYYQMFCSLTGLKPEICFILKLSKENGTYQIEELRQVSKLAAYARSMVVTSNGIDFIRSVRKDNQKVVGTKLEL